MGKVAASTRSPRSRISRHDVVAAACELLDDEGTGGFSMARVGQRLGVTAMALYRHVDDREDLESAVLDHVLADLLADDGEEVDWATGVSRWIRQVHDHWVRHPWIGRLIGSGGHSVSPSWLAALGRLATALDRAGLTQRQVARELVQISRVVVGVTLLEVLAPLPHVEAFQPEALARLDADERTRWEALAPELGRYANEALVDDLVTQTIERIDRVRTAS